MNKQWASQQNAELKHNFLHTECLRLRAPLQLYRRRHYQCSAHYGRVKMGWSLSRGCHHFTKSRGLFIHAFHAPRLPSERGGGQALNIEERCRDLQWWLFFHLLSLGRYWLLFKNSTSRRLLHGTMHFVTKRTEEVSTQSCFGAPLTKLLKNSAFETQPATASFKHGNADISTENTWFE